MQTAQKILVSLLLVLSASRSFATDSPASLPEALKDGHKCTYDGKAVKVIFQYDIWITTAKCSKGEVSHFYHPTCKAEKDEEKIPSIKDCGLRQNEKPRTGSRGAFKSKVADLDDSGGKKYRYLDDLPVGIYADTLKGSGEYFCASRTEIQDGKDWVPGPIAVCDAEDTKVVKKEGKDVEYAVCPPANKCVKTPMKTEPPIETAAIKPELRPHGLSNSSSEFSTRTRAVERLRTSAAHSEQTF